MKQSGYTLIELMLWCALSTVVLASMLGISTQIRNTERVATGYVSDLLECRRALHAIEWDVRCAKRVETTPTSIRIQGARGFVDYTLDHGLLTRTAAGSARILAHRIRTLTADQDGRTVRLHLTLLPRRIDPTAPEASIHSRIHLRQATHP